MTETAHAHAPQPHRASRRLAGWQILLGLAIFLLLLLLAVRGAIAWRYHAELDAWQADGYPTALVDLWKEFYDGLEPGAGPIYADALEAREQAEAAWADPDQREHLIILGLAELDDDGTPLTEQQLAVARQFLADHADTLRLLHEAAEAGGSGSLPVEPRDYEAGVLPHLAPIRGAAQVLFLEALVHAEAGDVDQAVRSLEAASYIPAMLENGLHLIEALLHDSVAYSWAEMARQVLMRLEADEAALLRLRDAARRAAPADRWHTRMLPAETSWTLHAADADLTDSLKDSIYRFSGARELDHVYILQYMRGLAEPLAIESEPERLQALGAYAAQPPPFPWTVRAADYLSGYDRGLGARYRTLAKMRSMKASLATLRFHLAHGHLPADLADLADLAPDYLDTVPLDPFTGDPLLYRILDDGFVIYSVNRNLVDSSGDAGEQARRDGRWDIPFRVRLEP